MTIVTGVVAVLSAGACEGPGADSDDLGELGEPGIEDSEERWMPSIDDVGISDPFIAKLDHVWIGPSGPGQAIVAYDMQDHEIGRISFYSLGSGLFRITHEYPRPCEDTRIEEECADVWDIAVNVAGDPVDHQTDVHQTLPGAVFSQRQTAILALVDDPDLAGSPLLCTFGVLASGAACFATPPPWVVGTCPAAVLAAVCACREALEKWDRDIKLDPVCGKD